MPDIVIFTQARGTERVWVAENEVDWWLTFYQRGGSPGCRWSDYRRWGGFFPPHPESAGEVMSYPTSRRRPSRAR